MDDSFDKLLGGGLGGGFMALLTDEAPPAPQQQAQQRLGSLAQPGPAERGALLAAAPVAFWAGTR